MSRAMAESPSAEHPQGQLDGARGQNHSKRAKEDRQQMGLNRPIASRQVRQFRQESLLLDTQTQVRDPTVARVDRWTIARDSEQILNDGLGFM